MLKPSELHNITCKAKLITDEEFMMMSPSNQMYFKLFKEVAKDSPLQIASKVDELRVRAVEVMNELGVFAYVTPSSVMNRSKDGLPILGLEIGVVLKDPDTLVEAADVSQDGQ